MRSNQERVAEVKRRVALREQQRQRQRNHLILLSATAASLAMIVGLSCLMPGIMNRITCGEYDDFALAANIFGAGAVLGYAVIALLAFVLGVCVAVLCYRIGRFQENHNDHDDGTV